MFAKALLLAFLPAALAVNHAVSIGFGGALVFNPNQVTAAIGDTVTFTVVNGNHSTTTTVLAAQSAPRPGGVGPTDGTLASCRILMGPCLISLHRRRHRAALCGLHANAGAHCRAGMTFALNPTAADMTYDQFKANAMALKAGCCFLGIFDLFSTSRATDT
ncbi:hypothetical protein C8J57DRAFT_1624528 [Mycena rebaudengoi]|nr:hypothetical protein C8J57DRAFT_1624528 [Mycena rebaudengoi]